MSDDWTVYAHIGTRVYVSTGGVTFTELKGYSGGLQFSFTDSLITLEDSDDGIQRRIKGNGSGAISTIAVRRIIDDPGQDIARQMCAVPYEDDGWIRAVYPDGRVITAKGLFHSYSENPIDGTSAQGFTFAFAQQEPHTEQ